MNKIISPREKQVLALLTKGVTIKDIALLMGLQYRTVEILQKNIVKKVASKHKVT